MWSITGTKQMEKQISLLILNYNTITELNTWRIRGDNVFGFLVGLHADSTYPRVWAICYIEVNPDQNWWLLWFLRSFIVNTWIRHFCFTVRIPVIVALASRNGNGNLNEVIRVKWKEWASQWCYTSGKLKLIGQFRHNCIGSNAHIQSVMSVWIKVCVKTDTHIQRPTVKLTFD